MVLSFLKMLYLCGKKKRLYLLRIYIKTEVNLAAPQKVCRDKAILGVQKSARLFFSASRLTDAMRLTEKVDPSLAGQRVPSDTLKMDVERTACSENSL